MHRRPRIIVTEIFGKKNPTKFSYSLDLPAAEETRLTCEFVVFLIKEENGQSVEDHSEYNILREAMANQMAHADHFSSQRSCIRVFDDRIEFSNPGGMPKPLDEMEQTFESLPRNPVIAKMFRLAHLSENLGYGLSKLKTWESVTGNPIRIETSLSSVKVTFYFRPKEEDTNVAKNVAKNVTERQTLILNIITETPQITRAEIADKIGVNIKTIERDLASMTNYVRYVGPKKGGYWEIKDVEID